ncbi:MAG TPA: M50 family metallopeptidase [Solirubrobacterales bacterium]|jgi:regulator of sigma E protease|nr:M50 family metallopeptidase [Solirubrobacterales bacterium]
MSWFLAFAAFAALIVLHEFGHFIAAKAVGMRVEKFSLFMPPTVASVRRGETEYAIGALPLGGYVKITGMNPEEDIPPDVLPRAYFNQPVWKRIVVIAAGPAVNVLIAFVLVFILFAWVGVSETSKSVAGVDKGAAAAGVIQPGDRLVSINGKDGDPLTLSREIDRSQCRDKRVDGCRATKPIEVSVIRDGKLQKVQVTPRYDAKVKRMRLGFTFGRERKRESLDNAFSSTTSGIWRVTKLTVALPARIFDSEKRKEISSAVGGYETTRQAVQRDWELTIQIIALISLSLAIINLFPFLPLDGGHIFWALVEKVRGGRPVPIAWMARASVIGIGLIAMLFLIGLSNDIDRFRNGGFGP